MKKFLLLILFNSFFFHFIFSQSIVELCPTEITNGVVVDMEQFNDTIYATGFFTNICGEPTNYIARLENQNWIPAAIEISDPGHSLRAIDDKLFIARYEESVDSNWVYFYDGNNIQKMGKGIYLTTASGYSELPNIYDIIEFDGKIIACGEFNKVGNDDIEGIMQWTGSDWAPLGMGLNGNISNTPNVRFPHQMMVHENELYVVGNFKNAGGTEVNGVAKWNGTNWSAMSAGFNNTAYSIAVFNNEIIVGGAFTESDGTPLNRIAKWNGSQWEALDFGFTSTSINDFIFVHTLEIFENELFIAGGLKEITYANSSTEPCGGIIKYDGQSINTFNQGVPNNDIEAIFVTDDQNMLVGGGVFGSGFLGQTFLSSSTKNLKGFEKIRVYPNPFFDEIQIDSEVEITHFSITDIIGREIFSGKINSNKIDSSSLTKGIYFLNLKTEEHIFIQKIIKK